MNNQFTQCKVCGEIDTNYSNGDCTYCTECYSVEQGFNYYEELSDGTIEDENGNIFDAEFNLIKEVV